ncbi:tripeptidyl-peptidase 1-like [Planoprotostelium fungivorum]|uniref:Tripeptidyl-peptidase 1-like n=1 Tax=Planoprotostelium fungivorum TaxID=1890364 RepID=A0A2P6N007_9EUKA|nr:tripeptidyl-peptidase 1-like [Planoprotostelium fungivorum]
MNSQPHVLRLYCVVSQIRRHIGFCLSLSQSALMTDQTVKIVVSFTWFIYLNSMRSLLFLCLLLAFAQAGRLAPHYHKSHGWVISEAADVEDVVRIGFGPKESAESIKLADTVLESISDPASPQFGRHLTAEEIHRTFGNVAALNKVKSYLDSHGIEYTVSGDHAWAEVPVHKLQKMLNTKFFRHTHPNAGSQIAVRAQSYNIPDELEDHIAIIYGVVHFPHIRKTKMNIQPTFFQDMTPSKLQQVYHVPNVLIQNSSQSQVILSASSGYIPSDLSKFFQVTGSALNVLGLNYPLVLKGPNQTADCLHQDCGESTLDLEYIMAMAPGIKTYIFNTRGDGFSELPNWLATDNNAPFVASASLGIGLDSDYAHRQCAMVQKAALRGVSFFVASGDSGGLNDDCSAQTDYPSGCPYMISIGGTDGSNDNRQEAAWQYGGVGNAANIFPQPDWQKPYAAAYRNSNPSGINVGNFNWNSRLYPDFAAHAGGTMLIFQGKQSGAMGTSFASPIFAGIISQINHQRALIGKGPVGLLNQLIAKLNSNGGSVFKDITTGSSQGGKCGKVPATTGWDLATGFGAPEYNSLYNALVKGADPTNKPTPTTSPVYTKTATYTYTAVGTHTITANSPAGCDNSIGSELTSPNQITSNGKFVTSPDCKLHLVQQPDGNVVIYNENQQARWATNGFGDAPHRLAMQDDGNLVSYSKNGVNWASNTQFAGQGPYKLVLTNEGKLSIVDSNGQTTWNN